MHSKNFDELVAIMARLRSDTGCPWDREQSHTSLRQYLLEEAYEVLEAIDQADDEELCKELGDVLLQVVFHAQIAAEDNRFDIGQVCGAIVDKLIHRHPHVFGNVEVDGADQVLSNWEELKRAERVQGDTAASSLDGIPAALPALLRAERIQHKASRQGFDWQDLSGPLEKVEEEFNELKEALSAEDTAAVEEEFGDLLFSLVNAGRFLKLCPEDAMRRSVDKFERRFRAVEDILRRQNRRVDQTAPEELDRLWEQVKD
jgi:tetrapyrrole methylase family protein/MazG family protein